ncbi:MAG: hypothetical protein RLN75_00020 [Longimicrobiales bacterium]
MRGSLAHAATPMEADLVVLSLAAALTLGGPPQLPPAPELGPPAVLFRSHDPIVLRIEADFDGLKGDRDDDEEERDGTLVILSADGREEAFPLEIRTRGNFRLRRRTCPFPPLRLDVPRTRMDGTAFEGQDKLKLVTHCRNRADYQDKLLREYVAYRIYSILTPLSFHARLARITYVDTSGGDDPVERWAVLLESEEALAERIGGTLLEAPDDAIHPSRILDPHAGRVTLFQYMIGNTDFSLYGPHNVANVETDYALVVPVPYDFDWTGLVDAPYAEPDPSLGLRSVRQRLFRGLCRPSTRYSSLYEDFLERRPEITAMVEGLTALSDDAREDVLEYLDDFWETVSDPDRALRSIERRCRTV